MPRNEPQGEAERLEAAERACERVLESLKKGDAPSAGLELVEVLTNLVPVLVEYRDGDWIAARHALERMKGVLDASE